MKLSSGRVLEISPGHPTAVRRLFSALRAGGTPTAPVATSESRPATHGANVGDALRAERGSNDEEPGIPAVAGAGMLMCPMGSDVTNGMGQVLFPHESDVGPVTAVRNSVLQTSLALLRERGLYERYAKLVEPAALRTLSTNLAPCWVPIDVVHAHYRACDAMALSTEELERLGQDAGQHARKVSIVVAQPEQSTSFDLWQNAERMHRVWKRLYRGGSVQVVKLGATEELIEFRGFSLHQHHYFRCGCVAAIRSAHEAVGVRMQATRIAHYDAKTHDLSVHLAWK